MINLHISFLFRELNEIVKTIGSRSTYEKNGYEINLMKNLNLIKNELQKERWNKFDETIEQSMTLKTMFDTNELLNEVRENNDCHVVTKVSRTLLRMVGRAAQGTANLMINKIALG